MKKKLLYSIGVLFVSVLLFMNITVTSTDLITTTDLQMLKSKACEFYPENWGPVWTEHVGQCYPNNPNSLSYGCVDGGQYCYPYKL